MIDPFEERPIEAVGEIVPRNEDDPTALKRRYIQALDLEVYRKHLEIVDGIGDWADLPEDLEKPEGWDEKRYRIAKAANLPKSEAPVGLTLSTQIHASYSKLEAAKVRPPETNNLWIVELTKVEPKQFPVRTVKKDER